MVTDPVCGMQIDERKAAGTSVYHGQTYYPKRPRQGVVDEGSR